MWGVADTFYRVHWTGNPDLSAANAWSALWGTERSADGSQTRCRECDGTTVSCGESCDSCGGEGWEDCVPGYSCTDSADELLTYFTRHGEPTHDEPVAIFEGHRIGTGFDGEPLAVPTGTVRWTTYGALRAETSDGAP